MTNPVVRTFVQLVSAAIAVVVLAMVGCGVSERRAEKAARDFCGALQVGMAVAPLEMQARVAGASEKHTRWIFPRDEIPLLPVTFIAFPMSRHVCFISGSPTLLKAEYVYLD